MLRVLRRDGKEQTKRALDLQAEVIGAAKTLPRRQRTANPSLVRDLAAEGGADLPEFVIEASTMVGIDVASHAARSVLITEGKEHAVAVADDILAADRRERHEAEAKAEGEPAPELDYESFTSHQQGAIVGDHLRRSSDDRSMDAVSDWFKVESDQPSFNYGER